MSKLLTIREAADRLNISEKLMRRLVWANEIGYIDMLQWSHGFSAMEIGIHEGAAVFVNLASMEPWLLSHGD